MPSPPPPPAQPPRPCLYVSRRQLPPHFGRYLFEDLLEDNLAAEGYATIYPEQLAIADQIAAYAGASRAILAESSAVHLALGVLPQDTPMVMVARRTPPVLSIRRQLLASGRETARICDAVQGAVVAMKGESITSADTFSAISILDLAALRDGLVSAGLCHGRDWRMPDATEVNARIRAAISERKAAMPGRRVGYVAASDLRLGRTPRLRGYSEFQAG